MWSGTRAEHRSTVKKHTDEVAARVAIIGVANTGTRCPMAACGLHRGLARTRGRKFIAGCSISGQPRTVTTYGDRGELD